MRIEALVVVFVGGGALLSCASAPSLYPTSEVCTPEPAASGLDTPAALIDNAEDGDNRIILHDGRDGFVFTFADHQATVVLGPTLSRTHPLPILGGANGSRCAWNLRGALADQPISFAGLGLNMTNPKDRYDASRYSGISFSARRSAGSSALVRLHVTDWNTSPAGGVCTECFNDFGSDILLSEEWRTYTLPFDSLRQLPGWGVPRPPRLDSSRIFSLLFGVTERGARFDVWIDDLEFVEAPPPPL